MRRTWQVLIVAIAVAWTVGLRLAIRWHGRRGPWPEVSHRDVGAERGAALAARVPAPSPPAERVGRSDANRLDALAVVALFRARRMIELAEVLEGAAAELDGAPEMEDRVASLVGALGFTSESDLPVLDAWVAGSPRSFVGYVARAAGRLASARRARPASCDADGWGYPTMETRKVLLAAREDVERAIELKPAFAVAYTLLARSFVLEGSPVPDAVLDRALRICPACSGVRAQTLLGLRHDRAAMHAFAEDSQALARENPRLRALLGYADWAECSRASDAKLYAEAAAACDRAVDAYPEALFLREKSTVLYWLGRYSASVGTLSALLADDPFDVDALVERARGYTKLEDWASAAPDLRLALQLEPSNAAAAELLAWLVERLEYDVRRASESGDLAEEFDAYAAAARLVPEYEHFGAARDAIALRGGLTTARTGR